MSMALVQTQTTFPVAAEWDAMRNAAAIAARSEGVRQCFRGKPENCFIAFLAARWIQPLLFKQSATDPITFGAVAAAMIVAAVAASAIPAMRAARADPNLALRSD